MACAIYLGVSLLAITIRMHNKTYQYQALLSRGSTFHFYFYCWS